MTLAEALGSVPLDVREDIERGVEILKAGGCKAVFLLGSIADGRTHPGSDIDFAVRGCPSDNFFKLQGRLLLALGRSADLIDLDVDPDLAAFLERETRLVPVG